MGCGPAARTPGSGLGDEGSIPSTPAAGVSFNGRTAGFGPENGGSTPPTPTTVRPVTYLSDILDLRELNRMVEQKYISMRPWDGAVIYNYTNKCIYDGKWNRSTMTCRGLICREEDGMVLARPFGKFFGVYESFAPEVPDSSEHAGAIVQDKWDGSLGVGWKDPQSGQYRIASRGSLSSDQAVEATRIWAEKYSSVEVPEGVTALFEIVYPENRIVVDYGAMRDLVLLATIDIKTGADLGYRSIDWPGPVAEIHRAKSLSEAVGLMDELKTRDELTEGLVVTYVMKEGPSIRYKLKGEEYMRLHNLVFNMTPSGVWAIMATEHLMSLGADSPVTVGKALRMSPEKAGEIMSQKPGQLDRIADEMPEPFRSELGELRATLLRMHSGLKDKYDAIWSSMRADPKNAKAFAKELQPRCKKAGLDAAPLFMRRKGDPQGEAAVIWRKVIESYSSRA